MVNKRKHVKICISIDENTHSRHSHVTRVYQKSAFMIDDQVTKTNKLKGITKTTLNLDELNNSVNLKDALPGGKHVKNM